MFTLNIESKSLFIVIKINGKKRPPEFCYFSILQGIFSQLSWSSSLKAIIIFINV